MSLRTRTQQDSILAFNRSGWSSFGTQFPLVQKTSAVYAPLNMGDNLTYRPVKTGVPTVATIVDEDPASYSGGPYGERYVYHSKLEPAYLDGPTVRYDYASAGKPSVYVRGTTMCWCDPSFPSWTIPWASCLDELCTSVQGYTKNSSLLLLTLKELGSTISMIRNPYNLLKAVGGKRPKRPIPFAVAERLSSGLLETTFGWKALYGDVTAIAKSAATIYRPGGLASSLAEQSERFSASEKHEEPPNKSYFGTTAQAFATWSSAYFPGSGVSVLEIVRSNSCVARCNATLLSNVEGRLSRSRRIFKLATAFGLTNWKQYREFLWEVVPYSFVLDWFIDTRGIWAPIVKHELEGANLTRISYSVKKKTEFSVTCKSPGWFWLKNTPGTYFGKYPDTYHPVITKGVGSVTEYVRTPGFPPSEQPAIVFNDKGLSLMQYALSGALAIQRLV